LLKLAALKNINIMEDKVIIKINETSNWSADIQQKAKKILEGWKPGKRGPKPKQPPQELPEPIL
jgi:hypothetical protein